MISFTKGFYCFSTFCLIAIAIAIFFSHELRYKREQFTPRIREMYRPYMRNARLYSKGVISNKKDDFNRLFRQFGLS
jgi:hypothetical protein